MIPSAVIDVQRPHTDHRTSGGARRAEPRGRHPRHPGKDAVELEDARCGRSPRRCRRGGTGRGAGQGEGLYPPDSPEALQLAAFPALVGGTMGRTAEMLEKLLPIAQRWRELGLPRNAGLAELLNNIGIAQVMRGDTEAGEASLTEVIDIRRSIGSTGVSGPDLRNLLTSGWGWGAPEKPAALVEAMEIVRRGFPGGTAGFNA